MSTALTTSIPAEVTGITREEQSVLQEILRSVQVSMDSLAKAAQLWIGLPSKTRKRIVNQTNASYQDFWDKLDRVGRGELHPQLATVGGTAAKLLGKLPLEAQEKYLRELVPVVVSKGKGWDTRLVDVAEMSEDQRKQVFKMAADGTVTVREAEAQQVWLSEKAARRLLQDGVAESLRKVERNGWRVEKGRVWVKPASIEAGLTRRQVEQMLKDLGS